jgi:hypothetical protein
MAVVLRALGAEIEKEHAEALAEGAKLELQRRFETNSLLDQPESPRDIETHLSPKKAQLSPKKLEKALDKQLQMNAKDQDGLDSKSPLAKSPLAIVRMDR